MKMNNEYTVTGHESTLRWFWGIGLAGLLASAVGYSINQAQFFHSYLVAFVFWVTVSLGGLFFTMLHHLTGAKWSTVLRRIPENMMMNLPKMAWFFLPILFLGMHSLYEWTHHEVVIKDHLLHAKTPYLNMTFFTIRQLIYFGIWFVLGRKLLKASLLQDSGHSEAIAKTFQTVSAPGMILFALSLTFASVDWLMSLTPHWFSTMFGVYTFAGSVLASLAFMTLVVLGLRCRGILSAEITEEHHHDLGKLMFAFTVFWTYIVFCQYMLIWYANIPEETVWFAKRWQGSWKGVSLLIVLGHFVLPFLVLLSRAAKRNIKVLKGIALWILFIHAIDLYWIVLPNLHPAGVKWHWLDFTTWLGIGGIYLAWFSKRLLAHPLVPVKDPHLQASMQFQNH